MNVSVRGVDADVFREFKVETIRKGFTVGEVVNELIAKWLAAARTRNNKSLLDIKPVDFGEDTDRDSSRVDEILYGVRCDK